MTTKKPIKFNFESSLKKLEAIVNKIEQGEPDLEESLKLFAEGVDLTKKCQAAIKNAEQKVKILTEEKLADFVFESEEDEEDE